MKIRIRDGVDIPWPVCIDDSGIPRPVPLYRYLVPCGRDEPIRTGDTACHPHWSNQEWGLPCHDPSNPSLNSQLLSFVGKSINDIKMHGSQSYWCLYRPATRILVLLDAEDVIFPGDVIFFPDQGKPPFNGDNHVDTFKQHKDTGGCLQTLTGSTVKKFRNHLGDAELQVWRVVNFSDTYPYRVDILEKEAMNEFVPSFRLPGNKFYSQELSLP